jgi:hypothetical protein
MWTIRERTKIIRGYELALGKQAEVLNASRGSIYYTPRPVPERDLLLMRRIDELRNGNQDSLRLTSGVERSTIIVRKSTFLLAEAIGGRRN